MRGWREVLSSGGDELGSGLRKAQQVWRVCQSEIRVGLAKQGDGEKLVDVLSFRCYLQQNND